MSDKVETAREENGAGHVKSGKRQTCMRHCKRFWWLHLIIFICIAVLVVCLIIFVAVPKIAQSKINEAKLEVQGINVLDSTPDSYRMEINSTITTDGSIKATVFGFTGDMYLEDVPSHIPFATLDFPDTNGDKHQVVNVSQVVKIQNMDAFVQFNTWFTNNETLRVTIDGHTQVQPSGLSRKYGVHFKKTLTMNGLNLFKGTKVTGGHVSLTEDANGKNFNGTAEIPNASFFTLDIGNASFINFVEDEKLGTLYIDNLFLVPGTNKVNVTANMDQGSILSLLSKRPYCENGIIPLKLQGDKVINNGQEITYFTDALASANQTVNIDIGSILKDSLGEDIYKATVKCQ